MASTASKSNINPIVLRKNSYIGSADAEMDDEYLSTCFLETEDVEALLDTTNPKRIVVGRTGAGKTALLKRIDAKAKNTLFLSPEDFSFKYLADSSVLNFFEAAGVNLNIFYLLLWRHIVCVELIKKKYNICNEDKMKLFLNNLGARLSGNSAKRKAFEYIEEWGDKFWETTEVRIKEITRKLEDDLSAKLTVGGKILSLGAEGVSKLDEEQRLEVLNVGKDVVNKIQIKKLTDVINLLDEEIFDDDKEKFYILIDKLDEDWADNSLRYKIIKALIDTIKKFQRVRNVKIITCLREDLLYRVLRETQDSGFQEEKIEPLYLRLNWNEDELEKILNLRVEQLFKRKYNQAKITINHILPTGQRDKKTAIGYILSRTFMRPREAILFVNFCLEQAVGKTSLSYKGIADAEMQYSRKRLRSLCDEWVVDYPLLYIYVNILHALGSPFSFKDLIQLTVLDDVLLDAACRDEKKCEDDIICRISKPYLDGSDRDGRHLLKEMVCAFYQVGVIGAKLANNYPVEWSYNSAPLLLAEQIKEDTQLHIHPTFWCALGISKNS